MITASSTSITNFVPLFKRRTELQSTCDYQHCPSTQTETILHLRDFSSQSKSRSVVSNSLRPHGILQARILEWVAFPFSRGSCQPRDQTQVSHIVGRSLPAEPQGKPKNTGVGILSLLQQIFPTQESNQGLLHCRQIHVLVC